MMASNNQSSNDEWKDFDFSTVKVDKPRATRVLPRREIVRFVVAGLVAGAMVWLVRLALEAWVMNPIFCRTPDTASICTNAANTSFIISLIIVGLITSSILAASRVFRSAIISAATFVSLAALWPVVNNRNVFVSIVIMAIFATLLYLFFSMIAAVKRYLLAVVLLIVFTISFWLISLI